jgi:hypothetical protein
MLSAALILKYQEENPTSPPLFRFAIFISSWLPMSWTHQLGHDVTKLYLGDDPLTTDTAAWQSQDSSGKTQLGPLKKVAFQALIDISPETETKWQTTVDLLARAENAHLRPRCFHPDLYDGRLDLATAHLWGDQDIFAQHARMVLRLCDSELATFYQHDGGHDIPQSWEDNERFSEIVQNTVLKSQFAV